MNKLLRALVDSLIWRRTGKKPKRATFSLPGDGSFQLEVVGESYRQEHLRKLCDHTDEREFTAVLTCEDANPVDRNAVRVDINGKQVGYLGWEDAVTCRAYFAQRGIRGGTCAAEVRGGGVRRETGEKLNYGVWLDFTLHG